jgi:hypothetical protein
VDVDGESISAFQVLLHGFEGRDLHHCHPMEHRHHDMMRPYVVLPRGAADGHGADARIPGRPPNP